MTKELNEEGILNELTGKSKFFEKSPTLEKKSTKDINRTVKRTVERSSTRTDERLTEDVDPKNELLQEMEEGKAVRRTKRYSFEAYEDQIEEIEKLQYKYKQKTGKRLSSSRVIRDAIEAYLENLK